nr:hypothetical protein OG296_08415 [Streptomyces sp. NBC_01001]
MATRRRAPCTAALTAALSLSLVALPVAVAKAERSLPPCPFAFTDVPTAQGYERLYTHSADERDGCSVVKNVSEDRVLQFWGPGRIDPPQRNVTSRAGWVASARAQMIGQRLQPGRVVVLPGERIVLYNPPPTYHVDLVTVEAAQDGKFVEGLASLAEIASAAGQTDIQLGTRLTDRIIRCGTAAHGTWQELGKSDGVEDLGGIYEAAKGLPACKEAYEIVNPTSANPERPAGWDSWRRRTAGVDIHWNTQLVDDAERIGMMLLHAWPRG